MCKGCRGPEQMAISMQIARFKMPWMSVFVYVNDREGGTMQM